MGEAVVKIEMEITQTTAINRGIGDVMRNVSLLPSGELVLDYEGFGRGLWHGTVVGKWAVSDGD